MCLPYIFLIFIFLFFFRFFFFFFFFFLGSEFFLFQRPKSRKFFHLLVKRVFGFPKFILWSNFSAIFFFLYISFSYKEKFPEKYQLFPNMDNLRKTSCLYDFASVIFFYFKSNNCWKRRDVWESKRRGRRKKRKRGTKEEKKEKERWGLLRGLSPLGFVSLWLFFQLLL